MKYIAFCGDLCIGEQQHADVALAMDAATNFLVANPELGNTSIVFETDEESELTKPPLSAVKTVHIRFSDNAVHVFSYQQTNEG